MKEAAIGTAATVIQGAITGRTTVVYGPVKAERRGSHCWRSEETTEPGKL